MLKISQPIITLMSPYLRENTTGQMAHLWEEGPQKRAKTHFSRVFFLLEGEKASS